ncbi:hypothetical protein CLFO_30310 [Clostridium formicaceticum]|uniref:Uncharacterized protein n=1 Tax=Clostridium formicaceticum TaxID=1497 RepID=A0AAC9RQX2_9CLOT|nr:hypothetical protein CLFO_30310 [Clostridium formicaceticum]
MKKPYEKPEMEVTVFEVEEICSMSGVTQFFGMDGTDI